MEEHLGILLVAYVILAIALVTLSALSRAGRAGFNAQATAPRFVFFVIWTLLLPLVLLWEWWGVGGLGWTSQETIKSLPAFVYGRKVVSDLWAAVAVILVALAWNKP